MSKEELKQYLEGLGLEEGLKKILFEIIDKAPQADQALMNTVAEILELQADFCNKSADLLEEEAGLYEKLADELDAIPASPIK